ncbi:hypothetical protein BGZ89_011628 [Linnemannia elongata]|nr:hypothetical protein BGZ89_011628 [Linnemannia elongata]
MAATPFDIPELVRRISLFVSVKDALSCVLVAKSWSDHFLSVIWFHIDFHTQLRFTTLPLDVVAKHGRHIRIVEDARSFRRVYVLANASVARLRELHIETTGSARQHVHAYEVVSRNIRSLEIIHLFAASDPDDMDKHDSSVHYVSVPALVPFFGASEGIASKLKILRLSELCLTHDGLVAILQASPQFLTILSTWQDDPDLTIPTAKIKEDIARYCPYLTAFELEQPSTLLSCFCMHIGRNISELTFDYEHISLEGISAILLHQATLRQLMVFGASPHVDLEADEVPAVSRHFQEFSQLLQLILRGCPHLETFDLALHEMDMDEVEMGEWTCKGLTTLRIRVKGLDTKETIQKAIVLWRAGCKRRYQEEEDKEMEGFEEETKRAMRLNGMDSSIEARVARHLLKFEHLDDVWLGYKSWTST